MLERDPRKNILAAEYELECIAPKCPGKAKIEHALSAGLRLGDLVPFSPGAPAFGRCHRCMRHTMRVVKVPDPPPVPGIPGFPRGVPTE